MYAGPMNLIPGARRRAARREAEAAAAETARIAAAERAEGLRMNAEEVRWH